MTSTPTTPVNGYVRETTASIIFNNTNITNPTYYIKSTKVGVTNNNTLEECGIGDKPTNCTSSSVTTLEVNTWYKVSGNINVTYNQESDENGTIYALSYDGVNYSGASTGTIPKVDRTIPTISILPNGNSTYTKTQSSVVTITEKGSGINTLKYKWTTSNTDSASNGTTFTSGDTITSPSNLAGTYYLCIYASDNVGNEINTCSNAFKIDNVIPTITKVEVNEKTATITASDDISGLQDSAYSCDNGDSWQASNICTYSSVGTYIVKVRDKAGNIGSKEVILTSIPLPTLGNLTPVVYENNNWKVVENMSGNWSDYDNQKWGNAVLLKSGVSKSVGDTVNVSSDIQGMFVWIPRYEYKIEGTYGKGGTSASSPGEIEVNFTTSTTASSGYRIHPAFTFGDKELDGIWMGKFETTGTGNNPTILPNVISLRNQNVSAQFATSQKFQIKGYDSHMAKNSEWGAAAYLSQSKYGNPSYTGANKEVAINSNFSYYTGGRNYTSNIAQSTTGNITGIYDMSGGAWEYVMGVYNKTVGSSGINFSTLDEKYYDNYTSTTSTTACSSKICYGHALSETSGWYSDYADFVSSSRPWFLRGGDYSSGSGAGVFASYNNYGSSDSACSFRVVLAQTT